MKILLSLLLAACCLLSSCSSTETFGRQPAGNVSKTAYLFSGRQLDDSTIHTAITMELQNRGFRVIDCRDQRPAEGVNGLVVRYMDDWKWDLVMYLSNLELSIQNGRNGELLTIGSFHNSKMHSYPSSKKVIQRMFQDFDRKKIL